VLGSCRGGPRRRGATHIADEVVRRFLTVEDDRVTALHSIRNPEKLGAV
jgi:hypothetical protein